MLGRLLSVWIGVLRRLPGRSGVSLLRRRGILGLGRRVDGLLSGIPGVGMRCRARVDRTGAGIATAASHGEYHDGGDHGSNKDDADD